MAYGRSVLGVIGTPFQLTADGRMRAKVGAATLDWTTFPAATGTATVLYDNWTVPGYSQFCRTGQVITRITASGKFGPYDPAAADGRQNLVRGDCFLVNCGVMSVDPKSDYPEAVDGGRFWLARVIQSGVAVHTLALGPTRVELEAAFPDCTWVTEPQ